MKRTIDICRSLGVGCIAVLGVVLVAGCVPYQTHQDTKDKLEQARLANQDLVRQLNRAKQRIGSLESGAGAGGVSAEQYNQAMVELASLRKQLDDRPLTMGFPRDVIAKAGAEDEKGGMRLGEALLFNPGVAELKSSQLPILDNIAQILRTQYPNETFIIEGHTDNQPLRSTLRLHEDNSNLGYKRARAVFKYLRDHGIEERQVIVMSYGKLKPIDQTKADTEDGRRANRRVVIRRSGARI